MSDFYTRAGDDGYTGLLGEGRVPKNDPRTDAVGILDEATAALGLARALSKAPQSPPILLAIQRDLYNMMAEVSATKENAARFRKITPQKVLWIEENISQLSNLVEMPADFIVPGDSIAGAAMSVARTVVRRAERGIVYLVHQALVENKNILIYLNRLSSLCFILELLENQSAGYGTSTLAKDNPGT